MRLEGDAVPTHDRPAGGVGDVVHAGPGEHGVARLDRVTVAQDRLRRVDIAHGTEMPLQIADPDHRLGDASGPGIGLDAEKLMGTDRDALHLEQSLGLAELAE